MLRALIIVVLLSLTINVINSKPKFIPRKHISNKSKSIIRVHEISKKVIPLRKQIKPALSNED